MKVKSFVTSMLILLTSLCSPVVASATPFKVLVVMSYEENNPWCQEIKEGIDSVLGKKSDITYFYMDTKSNFKGGADKAAAANELYRRLAPHGVITADDDAQAMYVLPYLKDRTDVPVMFCGVNADAKQYGFPTKNISGVLERAHVSESIAFLKQLLPSVKKIGFIVNNVPAGKALQRQVEAEKGKYLAAVSSFNLVSTSAELRKMAATLNKSTDAVYVDSLEGITDDQHRPMTNKEIFQVFREVYRKPIIGANSYHVEQGALCAVVKTGQEQGEIAANQLLQAMNGKPVSEIKIAQNNSGRRLINVDTMDTLGITPRPIVMIGATLVKTR
ncbi:MAG: ABC transporter substrate binding protein [Desulfuromonadaceae bacterium]|nr:ABC transporter substrate binding protein [Desulfuromonadaceae bacterium]